ncbi:DUF5590 domain-containing protein [Bacillus spongiae]|uniref:DUF5590 domain-containing protein n=1 Tax=Bacillus spongiae TaxID=2683610 RepID=A0ABU8HCY4_9BACI
MKKRMIGLLFFVISLLGVMIMLYINAREPFEKAKDYAIQSALEKTEIDTVLETYIYHGTQSYISVVGENKQNEKLIAFVPEDKNKEIIIQNWANGTTEKEAYNILANDKNVKELLSIGLGLEKGRPIWELAYLDEEDDLNYYYIYFETGEWSRTIENI